MLVKHGLNKTIKSQATRDQTRSDDDPSSEDFGMQTHVLMFV